MTLVRVRIDAENDNPQKGSWYLVTGLVIGILLGLIFSWVIAPVKYVDTVPASLRSDFKDEFRLQIASAFYATDNFPRAKARLSLLGDPDVIQALTIQAQVLLESGDPTNKAFLLALLTSAIKQDPDLGSEFSVTIDGTEQSSTDPTNTTTTIPSVPPLTTTIGTPSQQSTLISTLTLRPSSTPSPTPGAPFVLKSNTIICDAPQESLLLQVEVKNSANQPIPGAEIIVSWATGEEHFFTGLKPEIGDGYADFLMDPDVVYSIQLAKGGAAVSNLIAPSCSEGSGQSAWGSIKLVFQQP